MNNMNKARMKTYRLTEQTDQEYSDSESEQIQKKKQPRFFKYSLDKLDLDRIVLNVSPNSDCHYPIVTTAGKKLGWKVQQSSLNQNWDLYWTDSAIQSQQLFRMLQHQKINHFPGIYIIARKDCLARALMRMRKHQPIQYDFFPLTWHIPSETNEFTVQYQTAKSEGRIPTYIVKPEASCQGKGIFLTRKLQTIINQSQSCVVQKYIDRPYLINGLKFDFRIYVLLAGCEPLRIFVYEEGLARFATQQYIQPDKSNLKLSYIHLTNYAINKQNPAFVFNTSSTDMNTGHKRSLKSVFRLLEDQGLDIPLLRQKINDIIVKTIITGQPLLSHLYNLSQPDNYPNDMCFQILGFDILLEHNGQPKLLQVNHTPSFVTDTPLDEYIKENLIRDTLLLVNMTPQRKTKKVAISKQKEEMRFNCKKSKLTAREKIDLKETEQKLRDQYQAENLGGFVQAYPVNDNALMKKYNLLLDRSRGIFNKSNINKKITTIVPQVSSPSPRRNTRVKTIAPRDSLPKEYTLPREQVKPKQFYTKELTEHVMPALPSLAIKLNAVKSIAEPIKSSASRYQNSDDFRRSKSKLFEQPDQRKIEARVYQQIRQMEINNIERDLRNARKIEKIKNMSLGTRNQIEKSRTKDLMSVDSSKASPVKSELAKNYTTAALKGTFLVPKILRMSDMQRQMYEKQGRKPTNYQRFLIDHDLKTLRNSLNQ